MLYFPDRNMRQVRQLEKIEIKESEGSGAAVPGLLL